MRFIQRIMNEQQLGPEDPTLARSLISDLETALTYVP
jgi:hypothetical protein